jgi:hypothetical protein
MDMGKKKTVATMEHQEWVTLVRFESAEWLQTRDLTELKEQLHLAAERSGLPVLLDCTQIQAISTASLAVLLKFQRQLFEGGQRLKLYGLSRDKLVPASTDAYPHELFRIFELERFFDISDSSQMTFEECVATLHTHVSRHSDSSFHQTVSC